MKFAYVAGLIYKQHILRFKMLIYRKTRGNAITLIENIENVEEEFNKSSLKKSIYVVVFQESESMRSGIMKICESFSSGVYFFLLISIIDTILAAAQLYR